MTIAERIAQRLKDSRMPGSREHESDVIKDLHYSSERSAVCENCQKDDRECTCESPGIAVYVYTCRDKSKFNLRTQKVVEMGKNL